MNEKQKLYTKKGDRGSTTFANGNVIHKDNARVCAYGNIDELNSWVGFLISNISNREVVEDLERIQSNLLTAGSNLAQAEISLDHFEAEIKSLEEIIDHLDNFLPALKNFIFPGGNNSASICHIARTVCRRAERSVSVLLNDEYGFVSGDNDLIIIQYLNRLSDYFFVLSRFLNQNGGVGDRVWGLK